MQMDKRKRNLSKTYSELSSRQKRRLVLANTRECLHEGVLNEIQTIQSSHNASAEPAASKVPHAHVTAEENIDNMNEIVVEVEDNKEILNAFNTSLKSNSSIEKLDVAEISCGNAESLERDLTLNEEIQAWSLNFNVSHTCLESLLKILRRHGYMELPISIKRESSYPSSDEQEDLMENNFPSHSFKNVDETSSKNGESSTESNSIRGSSIAFTKESNSTLPELQPVYKNTCGCGKQINAVMKVCQQILYTVQDLQEQLNMNKAVSPLIKHIPEIPISSVEELQNIELKLQNDEFCKSLKQLLGGIGGNSNKDFLQRILKKAFTDEFAVKCSWHGLRGNIKINHLKLIEAIKNTLQASYPTTTDYEFEKMASEWFRLGKMRLARKN